MAERQSTGVPGLDPVLGGGLWPGSCTLLSGAAGTGKTTLGLQFLYAGAALGEGGVYVTFEEFPEQIYRDAAAFGWDLAALERAGKLQVVCVPPDAFLQEAQSVGGLLEELQAEVGMRRAVVDSLNLLHLAGGEGAGRRNFYLLRNAFQRLGVTTLFLHERSGAGEGGGADEFVADAVLYLTYDHLERHRLRHLEVRKHRGSAFLPGQHVFVFDRAGLRVLPALSRIPDLTVGEVVPTGLARLDEYLGGGLPRGSAFALNVNSKCNYRYLLGTLVAAHLRQGGGLISGLATRDAPADLWALLRLYGFDLLELGRAGRWIAHDVAGRPGPAELEPFILRMRDRSAEDVAQAMGTVLRRYRGEEGSAGHWLVTGDFNTAILTAGTEALIGVWQQLAAAARQYGHTVIAVCNFEEMGQAMTSFVERTAAGILRTWFDGRYQYLQVQKAPNGRVSEPMVIEYTEQPPYMALW